MKLFSMFNLLPTLQSSLAEKALVTPTEIQARAIPALLGGKSVVGVSETGSGKTLSYVLPVLHLLKTMENEGNPITLESRPRAAVIVPSRELGEQVSRVFKPFTHTTRLRVRTVLGGTTLDIAKRNIKGPFEVLVATPGRLIQLMERKLIHLDDVRLLIFDEVDQMLDPGFLPEADKIAKASTPNRQLGLFSATVSPKTQALIDALFVGAETIRSKGSDRTVATLKTVNLEVEKGYRFPLIEKLLSEKVSGGTLVFTNTREQCDKLAEQLRIKGYDCLIYRGEMDKLERRANLKAFREGKSKLLISTDLASRGLDVDHVGRIINYHLPQDRANYLHRVGRTARAGRKGIVFNLVTRRDAPLIAEIKN